MIKNLFLAALAAASICQADTNINGAGASFPNPVYQKWTYDYSQATPGVTVSYQSMGSGAGINQIKAGTVEFAGTDNPLTLENQEKFGLQMYPMLTGGVVVIVNIPGIKNNQLKLSQDVLAKIFMGQITRWNDKSISSLNPGLRIPGLKITVVRRADSSGTSFIFTNFLSKASAEWKKNIGQGGTVKWPVGIGGQKNPGVCNNVQRIRGSIGYTEFTYAVESKIATVILENADGKYVKPSVESFSASAEQADWANSKGFYMELTNIPGAKSWPITAVTYVLLRKDTSAEKRAAVKDYFMWCFEKGAKTAMDLHYIPLPKSVVEQVEPKL